MPNITSITVSFGHGVKREDFGPTKKAEVSITVSVDETDDGAAVLDQISGLAMAKVADMLSAPRPDTANANVSQVAAQQVVANDSQDQAQPGEPPARRTRGPNKPKDEPVQQASEEPKPEATPTAEAQPAEEDEWAAGAEDIVITDQELLSATSKRAGELGAREPIVKLIATFATRTEGAPFKVQEIPANQRKDYLTKLAALTA